MYIVGLVGKIFDVCILLSDLVFEGGGFVLEEELLNFGLLCVFFLDD